MKLSSLLTGVGIAAMLTLSPVSSLPLVGNALAQEAVATVSISVFFDNLAPHGIWVKHPKYRYVFCPKVDADWRPYTNGHWVYLKDYGWYFASDEPFAWAVYHYGRWFDDDRLGWCWVPGNAWAGAWVSWRQGDQFIGWAPLAPTREGFVVDVDLDAAEPPKEHWVFVEAKQFLEPQLKVTIVFGDQKPDVFEATKFVGPVVVQNNIVVNTIIDVNFIQQVTNQKVVVVTPQVVDKPDQVSVNVDADAIAIFSPQIEPPKQDEAPQQAVEVDQAVQDLGRTESQPSAEASSAASEPSSEASSAESSSSVASSAASSAEISSSSAASSVAPSSEVSSAPASEQASSSEVSSEPPVSSAPASEEPSSSLPPSSEPSDTSSASSVSSAASSEVSSAAESSESQASSATSSEPCPVGYELIKGVCLPIESSAAQ
jgi:hypothetical protein